MVFGCPDLDIIGFSLGVPYGDFLGHRGFFHSLCFAFLLSSTVMLLAFRRPPVFSKKWWLIWLFFFAVSSSHGILDAFNNAGLGIALLSPFNTTRYFSPWRPLVLTPMAIRALFTPLGREMLLSELYWIWLPLILALIIAKAYRRIKDQPENPKRAKKRIWLAAIIIIIAVIFCLSFWRAWQSKSINEQLAEIEAARAIPPEENAAVVYNKLMQDPNSTSLSGNWPQFILNKTSEEMALIKPWQSEDYAKLAAWVKEKQPVINDLLEASKFNEKCRFPIEMPLSANRAMRNWTFLLRLAVINDIGNGRIDNAIDKWRCLLQMGHHLRQQPLFDAHLVAIAIEAVALRQTIVFLVQGNADETHLRKIEMFPLHTEDNWIAVLEEIIPAEELAEENWKGQMGFIERVKYVFGYGGFRSQDRDVGRVRRLYRELLARGRGLHVLVALRRYRNKHGRWPESLDQIQSQVPAEMFIDPFNNDSFVYKLTDDSFTFYSKGPNKLDENGKRRDGCDDCPIWLPKTRKNKNEKDDTQQSNTQKEVVK
ncbi:MAG: metal-dependent hydrolase [Planctomycetota bacterium]